METEMKIGTIKTIVGYLVTCPNCDEESELDEGSAYDLEIHTKIMTECGDCGESFLVELDGK